jgi:glycosyltransferase involved in cell wall biosynthesis
MEQATVRAPDTTAPMLSIVTPAYNELRNLPVLYEQIQQVLAPLPVSWEWLVVDDHSADNTFVFIRQIAGQDQRVGGIRFSRNFGSHAAIACGLRQARGGCVIVMAADLQDPPETIPELLDHWQRGSQVVWAVRAARAGESAGTRSFARLYYGLMRRTTALKNLPPTGADFFLLDRVPVDAINAIDERNSSLLLLLTWMGFRQSFIFYTKQPRLYGKSGWSIHKKLKLVVDSLTAFTYLPIRLMTYLGFMTALLGFVYAAVVILNALVGTPVQGYPSLMVAIITFSGIQMLMLGVLGEYLWRALDESRRRPRYLVEDQVAPGFQLPDTPELAYWNPGDPDAHV